MKRVRKKSHRILAVMLAAILAAGVLSGCGAGAEKKKDRFSIVCTIFPEYDWVKNIVGDRTDKFDITLLLDSGVDLHSFQPTAEDIMTIADCDLFLYVGGESDRWVNDALKERINKNMVVMNLMEVLGDGVKEEETVEGMEENEEEDEEEAGDPEKAEYDEHIWLSVKNAETLVDQIAENIILLDPENRSVYENNKNQYQDALQKLDEDFSGMAKEAAKDTVVFGDRFPFRYLMDDYNIRYYAAFQGCSAETEASFETVIFLAGKVDELGLKTVFVTENSDQKLAKTIISNTKEKSQKVLSMNSMQSTTMKDIRDGQNYLDLMKENLESLKKALG